MSKSMEGVCNTGGGTDHGKGDPCIRRTFWEGFDQGETNGQDQKPIPGLVNP